jgi:hypothetical protein
VSSTVFRPAAGGAVFAYVALSTAGSALIPAAPPIAPVRTTATEGGPALLDPDAEGGTVVCRCGLQLAATDADVCFPELSMPTAPDTSRPADAAWTSAALGESGWTSAANEAPSE